MYHVQRTLFWVILFSFMEMSGAGQKLSSPLPWFWRERRQMLQDGYRDKRSCRAGVEKKGMYKEKSEHDVIDFAEVCNGCCVGIT